MEPFSTTYAKAVDDLAAKIFLPALICSLFVEFGPYFHEKTGAGFFGIYLFVLILGGLLAFGFVYLTLQISIWFFDGHDVGPEIGVAIMPLGFAGLFPEQFAGLNVPYSQVTGVAILAWAFMLVKGKRFFRDFFWED